MKQKQKKKIQEIEVEEIQEEQIQEIEMKPEDIATSTIVGHIFSLSAGWIKSIVNADTQKEAIKELDLLIKKSLKEKSDLVHEYFIQTTRNEDEVGGLYFNVYFRVTEYAEAFLVHIEPRDIKITMQK